MIISDLYLPYAREVKEKMYELYPTIPVKIVEGDYNLFKLGFVDNIPCALEINITEEEINEVIDEMTNMECIAYNCTDPVENSAEMLRYLRYEVLQNLFLSIAISNE